MNDLLRLRIWSSFLASSDVGPCDVPFRYGNQHPAGARWHAHLIRARCAPLSPASGSQFRGLATEIHEISGLDENEQDGGAKVWGEVQVLDVSSCFFVTYAL